LGEIFRRHCLFVSPTLRRGYECPACDELGVDTMYEVPERICDSGLDLAKITRFGKSFWLHPTWKKFCHSATHLQTIIISIVRNPLMYTSIRLSKSRRPPTLLLIRGKVKWTERAMGLDAHAGSRKYLCLDYDQTYLLVV
jgi:hypothetical protein